MVREKPSIWVSTPVSSLCSRLAAESAGCLYHIQPGSISLCTGSLLAEDSKCTTACDEISALLEGYGNITADLHGNAPPSALTLRQIQRHMKHAIEYVLSILADTLISVSLQQTWVGNLWASIAWRGLLSETGCPMHIQQGRRKFWLKGQELNNFCESRDRSNNITVHYLDNDHHFKIIYKACLLKVLMQYI